MPNYVTMRDLGLDRMTRHRGRGRGLGDQGVIPVGQLRSDTPDSIYYGLWASAATTLNNAIAHGDASNIDKRIADAKSFSSKLTDPAEIAVTNAWYVTTANDLARLSPAEQARRAAAAQAADAANTAAVTAKNADPAFIAATAKEKADIEAGLEAQRLGIPVGIAYRFGLGPAKALGTVQNALGVKDLFATIKKGAIIGGGVLGVGAAIWVYSKLTK